MQIQSLVLPTDDPEDTPDCMCECGPCTCEYGHICLKAKNIFSRKSAIFPSLMRETAKRHDFLHVWGPFGRQRRVWLHGADPPGVGLGTEGGWLGGTHVCLKGRHGPTRGGGSASERALLNKPKWFTFSAGTAPFKSAIQCIHDAQRGTPLPAFG